MPVYRLDKRLVFPPVERAEDGLLAVGGDLSVERLLLGYSQGIFPWYGPKLPILWHAPDPRMVMAPRDLIVNRSLKKAIRRQPYRLTIDTAFADVLAACAEVPRPGQDGTWIIPAMIDAYRELHARGFAHSFEAWQGDRWGNLTYRQAARNFGPVMAMAARCTVASVHEVLELGQLDPEAIVTPGIFVHRVVRVPRVATAAGGFRSVG